MRISLMPGVCSGLLCGWLALITGCGNPSPQTLVSLTVTATPSTVPVGGASALKAMVHLSDGTTQDVTAGTLWTSSNTAMATMSNGALTAKAPGTVTVQAAYVETAPAGSSPASTTVAPQNLSASTQVTITPSSGPGAINIPTLSWNTPAAISYGTALSSTQLNATANVPGTFVYTPAVGTVLKAGTQTLSAVFTPADTATYSAATASVQLTVNQATPVITWTTPAPITAGTALSATQLDATANVPGSFVYSPAAGKVLTAGTQQLTAVFSPTDNTDYSSATANTSLTVKASPTAPAPTPTPTPAPTGCGGPTVNVNSGMSQSTLQSTISSAPSCAMIVFAAGTYNITAPITLQCGVTYTGPVANPATAILSSTFSTSGSIFNLYPTGSYANPCTNPTTIEYLDFLNSGGIYVQTSFTNLNILHNQFGNLPCCGDPLSPEVGIFFDGGQSSSNTAQSLTNTLVQWNTIGDSNSCQAAFADVSSPDGDGNADGCAGMIFNTTIGSVTIENNNIFHVGEGIHVNCPGGGNPGVGVSPCEPTSNGATTRNMTVQYNDFNQVHRINWEEQPQATSGVVFQYNSIHDMNNPAGFSFGLSFACCSDGATSAYLNVSSNVIIFNTPPQGRYGYGSESWGLGATYNNNMLQSGNFAGSAPAIAWGCGPVASVSYNVIQGGWQGQYYQTEGLSGPGGECQQTTDGTPASMVGNNTGPTVSTVTSAAPTISPSGGTQSFPLTVTLTDAGYTSGAQPLANTGVWYTTDGSTPVPGSGTAQYLASGGTFVLTSAATVNAVGMWGAANQPTSYPAGYGFVPSSVVTAAYSAGGAIRKPAATPRSSNSPTEKLTPAAGAAVELPAVAAGAVLESVTISPMQPVVAIGSTTQLKAIAAFNDGSNKDVTADFGWQSSDARTIAANSSGTLAGVASGKATITGSYQGLHASVSANSTVGEVVWSDPIVISEGGTYSGNWQSTDITKPAVTVATTAPVIIENSHIRSAGSLIATSVAGSNLTVRNSLAVASNAAVKGQPNGVFLEVSSPARLDVENNYIENAQGGVIVHGYAGNRDGQQTIVIRSNRARNMNGLLSDGNGGYLPGEGANRTQARFIQFDSVQSVPGIDVGWNEVINYPGHSLVQDNIDVYRSSGTLNQPLEIHDTYIQGAYPYPAAQDAYTGGGIKTDAKAGDSAREVPAFNSIHDNQVVGTATYGIQFAAGHDNAASNNRVISSGLLADGTRIRAQQVGMANSDAHANGSTYNNTMRDNVIGWTCWSTSCAAEGYRKDQYFPASPADYFTNSVIATPHITLDMESNEYQVWVNKMATAGVAVGPSF
jgi:Bacterial Ig-like domain (group 2)